MYSFRNDYSEGAHPQVLRALTDTNLVQTCGYGVDPICDEARALIRTLCAAPDAAGGYRFSKAMENPGFIGVEDIQNIYLPMGFSNFKIEGRSLGSALVLEFLLHYLTRPEYQLHVREEIYLDNMLDLF